ncbi:MAG: SOS response-associated peptidase [Actinomycetota bacterium]|nr:SOS response-associated peptidase [Actinomycetota bacterium]
MCGRFVAAASANELTGLFEADIGDDDVAPNYNVAPSAEVYATFVDDGASDRKDGRRIEVFSWGFLPKWAQSKSSQKRLINARAETVDTKASFADAFASRRCIIPASGFYEWKVVNSPGEKKRKKQPMFIFRSDQELLCMAGVWERQRVEGTARYELSFTILTTEANEFLSNIHHRMPVVLPQSTWVEWLDPQNSDIAGLKQILRPAPSALFEAHRVNPKVGNPRHNGPELTAPLAQDSMF